MQSILECTDNFIWMTIIIEQLNIKMKTFYF